MTRIQRQRTRSSRSASQTSDQHTAPANRPELSDRTRRVLARLEGQGS